MDFFERRDDRLYAEQTPLSAIADRVGTPVYVYSRATLRHHLAKLTEDWAKLDPDIRYAVKANGNLALLRILARAGSGFDVVSRGEIGRVLRAGGDPATIDFAGIGKRRDEIEYALATGIGTFNVESREELAAIDAAARRAGTVAAVALRVNPDVDARTHRHITTGLTENKFGVNFDTAREMARRIADSTGVKLTGLHLHIGSQMLEVEPFREAVARGAALSRELLAAGVALEHINLGGGFGIHYRGAEAPSIEAFARAAADGLGGLPLRVRIEPGRLVVGNAGVLLTRVLYVKQGADRRFVICDAGMTDLLRPSLYDAYHRIEPVEPPRGEPVTVDVVGPVCESADAFARDRELPPVQAGDLLCVRSAGAYGFVMANQYNARPRAAEVLVDGDRFGIVRERETDADLMRGEHLEPRWI